MPAFATEKRSHSAPPGLGSSFPDPISVLLGSVVQLHSGFRCL